MDHNTIFLSVHLHEQRCNPVATARAMSDHLGTDALKIANFYRAAALADGRSEGATFWTHVCVSITQQRLERISNALPSSVDWPMMSC